MATLISIEFGVLFGVAAWAAADLSGASAFVHALSVGGAAAVTLALSLPIWRRMLRPVTRT